VFKKTMILTLAVLFLLISTIVHADPEGPTFADLVELYPEMLSEDLDNYTYTIEEHGIDYYLVKIDGTWWIVKA
jgi:hypothetical protein